jgi:hypothetical protein
MEFLVRNFDSSNPDPELDRSGCRKRGMVDDVKPDGQVWGRLETLPRFVVLKCPGVTEADAAPYERMRKVWRDRFEYEITGQNANQGWYDVRVYETSASPTLNRIIGAKADKIRGFLQRWGCSQISLGDNALEFRFDLWDAARSVEFWDVTADQLAQLSFTLVSYSNGVGTIRVEVPEAVAPMRVLSYIVDRGGVIVTAAHPVYVFTLERGVLLAAFRDDVREKAEAVFMYQRYRFNPAVMDAAEAADGVLTLTRQAFLDGILDSMAV